MKILLILSMLLLLGCEPHETDPLPDLEQAMFDITDEMLEDLMKDTCIIVTIDTIWMPHSDPPVYTDITVTLEYNPLCN